MKPHHHRYFLGFLVIIFVGLFVYYVVRAGLYPVAIVDGKLISAHQFGRTYDAYASYHEIAVASGQAAPIETDISPAEAFGRAGLDRIIEAAIIRSALENRHGGAIAALVDRELENVSMNDDTLERAARVLYGLTVEEFRDIVLIPEAERQVLSRDLEKDGEVFSDWIIRAREDAKVRIIGLPFRWSEGEVVLRDCVGTGTC